MTNDTPGTTETQDTTQAEHLRADPFAAAYPELRAFWDAAEDGSLLLKSCTQCGKAHWYPRMICPFCHSRDLQWKEAQGRGIVHSYSVMRKVEVPYVLAYVELVEQVVLMTNIVDCGVDDVRIGQSVRLVFRRTHEGRLAPYFAPA